MLAPPATQLERGALILVELGVHPPGAGPVGVEADDRSTTRGDDRVGADVAVEDSPARPAPPGLLAIVWTLGRALGYLLGRRSLPGLFMTSWASAAAYAAGARLFLFHDLSPMPFVLASGDKAVTHPTRLRVDWGEPGELGQAFGEMPCLIL